ncbi:MAG: hypothetical protein JXA52_02980 [Planctomycetes bacterium]|nr:hypothetical protein [Planctomycetota bacterium]
MGPVQAGLQLLEEGFNRIMLIKAPGDFTKVLQPEAMETDGFEDFIIPRGVQELPHCRKKLARVGGEIPA